MTPEAFVLDIEGSAIHGRIHRPAKTPAPVVVCSHGLFSSMASPKFVAIAETLVEAGFIAVRYDHRGCGISGGRIEETTVTGRLADLQAVLRFLRPEIAPTGVYGMLGSSMGGYISLFAAAEDAACRAVVAWATPCGLKGRRKAFQDADAPRLQDAFFVDLERHHLEENLGRIQRCLILHGTSDELVPCWHAERNHSGLAQPKRLELFPGCDHRFSRPQDRRLAIQMSAAWFNEHLT